MSVILARVATTLGAPLPVHAWHVPSDGGAMLSACGLAADEAELESVDVLSGVPCGGCLQAALSAPARVDAAELGSVPVIAVDGRVSATGHRYGVALRGERHAHLVAPDAVSGRLEGRDVIQTVCAHLAWGPLANAPHKWPLCPECVEITSAS